MPFDHCVQIINTIIKITNGSTGRCVEPPSMISHTRWFIFLPNTLRENERGSFSQLYSKLSPKTQREKWKMK